MSCYHYDGYNPALDWQGGAAGRLQMDMLSVLLHEVGHVLGIEHSAHSGDYMAGTLQAGIRRLPSAEELSLMAQLVSDIAHGAGDPTPSNPNTPIDPLGGGSSAFVALLLGRRRREASTPGGARLMGRTIFNKNVTIRQCFCHWRNLVYEHRLK